MASNGPITWFAHYDADQECYDIATSEKPDEDGSFEKVIATVWANRPSLKATANQDAMLIAAAPQLLHALNQAITALNSVLNFNTSEGIKNYALLYELDKLVNQFETEV